MRTSIIVAQSMVFALALCAVPSRGAKSCLFGGFSDASVRDKQVVAAAEFAVKAQTAAVSTHEKPVSITLVKILKAEQQVVAGMNYQVTLLVKVDGVEREAAARIWRKLSGEHELTVWRWVAATK